MAEPSAGSRAPYRIMVIVGLVGLGLWATYDYWGGLFANASAPGNQQSTIETKAKPKRGVPVLVDAVESSGTKPLSRPLERPARSAP